MWHLALAALAAAPAPRAAAHADLAVFVPRLDKLADLGTFTARAGERTALLRPQSWASEFHPLLSVDPTRPASLTAAGIDPAGDATVSWLGEGKLSCVALADPALFQKRADERLAELGTVTRKKDGGASLVTSSLESTLRAGYALSGRYACSFRNSGKASLASDAVKRAQKGATPPEWQRALSMQGVAFAVERRMSSAVRATPASLTAQVKGAHLPLPALRPAGPSPYAAVPPSGLLFARAMVDEAGVGDVARWLSQEVAAVCSSCAPGALAALADQLAPSLTGNVLLRVDRAEVKTPLQTAAGRFFALRQAYLAELKNPGAVKELLVAIKAFPGARDEGEGFALPVSGGEVLVGVHGPHLYVANDARALRAVLDASAKPAVQGHGVEAWVDPALASKGLRQVSLLDVMTSQELASLFAAGTELGPLLGITERITARVDGVGDAQVAELTWALAPDAPR